MISHPASAATVLPGRWWVHDPAGIFSRQQTLTHLLDLSAWLASQGAAPHRVRVELDPQATETVYWPGRYEWLVVGPGAGDPPRRVRRPRPPLDVPPAVPRPESAELVSFGTPGDRRWQTVGLPVSALFLGSPLRQMGLRVTARRVDLPAGGEDIAFSGDLVGFSLFEDHLPPALAVIERARQGGTPLLAAGGPWVTLAPLAAAAALPGVHLLVRGEAEFLLPRVLRALAAGRWSDLFRFDGLLCERPGWLLVSGWDRIVRPGRWPRFPFTFDLVPAESLRGGLEITLSRGCHFRCSFCCKLQGAERRRLSPPAVERLLATYRARLDRDPNHGAQARHVNINDDDLLQDPGYARRVFSLLLRHRLELVGVQTSLATLDTLHRKGGLTMLTRPALFAGGRPLLWIGSDTFLVERGRRLRKPVLAPARLEALLTELDRNVIAHHHYWISSDADSTWPEFIREFLLLIRLLATHPQMGLLPHAPFVIPYVGTELHRRAIDSGQQAQIVTRGVVAAADPRFAWPLAGRLETRHPGLNRLLLGEAGQRGPAFLRALSARDFLAAIQPVFHALGQERRSAEERGEAALATELRRSEDRLADEASRLV